MKTENDLLKCRIEELENENKLLRQRFMHYTSKEQRPFQFLFENSEDGFAYCKMIFRYDKPVDFIYLSVNPAFEKISGLKGVENKKFSDLFPEWPLKDNQLFQNFAIACLTGNSQKTEYFFPPLEAWISFSTLCPETGCFVIIFNDISAKKKTEQELLEREARLRAVMESTTEVIGLLDKQGNILDANEAFARLLQKSRSDLPGQNVFNLISKEIPDQLKRDVGKVIATGEPFHGVDCTHSRWHDFVINPIRIKSQHPDHFALFMKDITESKKAVEEMSSIILRYENLLKTASDGIHVMDEEGNILEVSDSFCQMLGYSREELLSMKVSDIDNDKTAAEVRNNIDKSFVRPFLTPARHRRKDGTILEVEVSLSAINIGGQIYCYASARDISQRSQMEKALRDREQLYYALFEKNKAVKGIIDPTDGSIVEMNSAACQFYGYSADQLKNLKISDLNTSTPEEIHAEMAKAIAEEKTFFNFKHKKSNGDLVDVEVYSSPIEINGRKLLHSIIHDVTSQKEAEKALLKSEARLWELNATKDKFFSIIGHDLRSPFNAIWGFSNLLLEQIKKKDYDGIAEYATIIENSSARAVNLLNNLIDWSRSQTDRIVFKPEYIDIIGLIQEAVSLMQDMAKQKSIKVTTISPNCAGALADRSMINTILRNLISNALKFTKNDGRVEIKVDCQPLAIVVSVQDNGIGINEEDLTKLFRIEETQSTPGTLNEKGTGLGLILCKEFVDKHNGKIWVESIPGKGSTFYFTIPIV